jgi:hypothetical protein
MSRKFPIYHFVIIGVVFVSLFLPYKEYDLHYNNGIFGSGGLKESGVQESGINLIESIVPLIVLILTSFMALIARNLATAIVGLILSILLVLYLPFEAFVLTFTIFSPKKDVHVQIGFYISVLAILSYLVFTILHLIQVSRERKKTVKVKAVETDILDDFSLTTFR